MNCKWVSFGLFNQVQDLLKLWLTATGETGRMPAMDWESGLVCKSSWEPLTLFPTTCEYCVEEGRWSKVGATWVHWGPGVPVDDILQATCYVHTPGKRRE